MLLAAVAGEGVTDGTLAGSVAFVGMESSITECMGKAKKAAAKPVRFVSQEFAMVPIADLVPHPDNPNKGASELIADSISANGFYGAILVQQSSKRILAGHYRLGELQRQGANEAPVLWLDVDDKEALSILLADNETNRAGKYDKVKLKALLDRAFGAAGLQGTGFTAEKFAKLAASVGGTTYSRKIEAPIYEPKNPCPHLSELLDRSKADELIAGINEADLPEPLKEFLRAAAERHVVFNFKKIADYYAHADVAVQDLMERSALVIIDFDKAIEYGFVNITEKILALVGESESEE